MEICWVRPNIAETKIQKECFSSTCDSGVPVSDTEIWLWQFKGFGILMSQFKKKKSEWAVPNVNFTVIRELSTYVFLLLYLASGFHFYQDQNMPSLTLAMAFIFQTVKMKRNRSKPSLHLFFKSLPNAFSYILLAKL